MRHIHDQARVYKYQREFKKASLVDKIMKIKERDSEEKKPEWWGGLYDDDDDFS
jgi:hypothetical protein